jgi:hypothetical protein
MFSYHNQLLPSSFLNLFITNNEIHDYNTRNASSYRAHACRTNVKQFIIIFQGPKLWNSLPEFIKSAQTINCFRGLLWGPRSPLLCATLCDIRRHWQFSKKGSMRRWAKLGDIRRHWTELNSNIQTLGAIRRH